MGAFQVRQRFLLTARSDGSVCRSVSAPCLLLAYFGLYALMPSCAFVLPLFCFFLECLLEGPSYPHFVHRHC